MTNVVPVFPLPGVFLFPGQVLPLHVFEPRYRQMVEDLLDRAGRLVIGTIRAGREEDEVPEILDVAGLGEIARHERLPDGRYTLLVFGLQRVRIEELPSERLYRKVAFTAVEEQPASPQHDSELHDRLIAAIRSRTGFEPEKLEGVSTSQLTDVLAQCLTIPQERMETIFIECEVDTRAARVLAAHKEFPPVA